MKKVKGAIVFVVCLLIFACSNREVDLSQVQKRSGKAYIVNEKQPYSGVATSKYSDGQLKAKENFSKGVLNGEQLKYFPNGQLQAKLQYKDGRLEGVQERYYENGQLAMRGTYEKGVLIGKYETYGKNGEVTPNVQDIVITIGDLFNEASNLGQSLNQMFGN